MKIYTETGSIYNIDLNKKTWTRLTHDLEQSPNLRTETGNFISCNEPSIGKHFQMWCPAITPNTSGRLISTSLIIKIED